MPDSETKLKQIDFFSFMHTFVWLGVGRKLSTQGFCCKAQELLFSNWALKESGYLKGCVFVAHSTMMPCFSFNLKLWKHACLPVQPQVFTLDKITCTACQKEAEALNLL